MNPSQILLVVVGCVPVLGASSAHGRVRPLCAVPVPLGSRTMARTVSPASAAARPRSSVAGPASRDLR
jgi:hypothetical protein